MTGSPMERLERALIRLGHPQGAERRQRATRPATVPPATSSDAGGSPESTGFRSGVAGATQSGPALPVELAEMIDRLDGIADRLADMKQPGRPLPATREIFSEWVRLRKWETMPFAEFLSLRRAGRI